MSKFLIFFGMTAGGWLGWWAGERFGIMTALFFSGIGSMLGVYIGWRIARNYD